jgi:hypothetical protein
MSKRTDIHRKGAIIPGNYEHVLSYNGATSCDGWPIPSYGINCELDRRWEEEGPDGKTIIHNGEHDPDGHCCVIGLLHVAKIKMFGHTGQCAACGTHFVYGEVWRHIPTNEYIHIGHICGANYGLIADRSEFELRAGRAREAAAAVIRKKVAEEEREAFLADHPGLEKALETEHYIVQDIRARFLSYHGLSDAQIALVFKLAAEAEEPSEKYAPAPEGRVRFSGELVSIKSRESRYGSQFKMTVKVTTDEGVWIAWGTCPEKILVARLSRIDEDGKFCEGQIDIGDQVELTATLTRGRDDHFAIMKRPVAHIEGRQS